MTNRNACLAAVVIASALVCASAPAFAQAFSSGEQAARATTAKAGGTTVPYGGVQVIGEDPATAGTVRAVKVTAAGLVKTDAAVTSSALPTGAATDATLSAASAKLPASLGAKTGSASLSVVPATDATFKPAPCAAFATAQTAVNETADTIPVAALSARSYVVVRNKTGNDVWCGATGVATTTGMKATAADIYPLTFPVGTAALQCVANPGESATVESFECAY